jgi:hypothetical protein
VTVQPYENMAEGDIVTVRWNADGNDTAHAPLTAAELQKPVVIDIDSDTIEAGGVGEDLKITYQVYDLAYNWSLWSLHGRVNVPDPTAPPVPWVTPTVGNQGTVIDVDALGSGDIEVAVEASGAATGENVTVHWAGTTATGQPVTYDTAPQQPSRPNETLRFDVPNASVRPLAQGTARAWYTIASPVGIVRTSARRNLELSGQATRLLPPEVDEAKGSILDITHIPASGAHPRVPQWDGMQAGDTVELVGEGRMGNGNPTRWGDTQVISANMVGKPVPFILPRNEVLPLVDGSLRLYYLVTPFGMAKQGGRMQAQTLAPLRSDVLDLQIRDADAQPLLPIPTIPELVNGGLDPDVHVTARLVVPVYPGIAAGDRVDIALRGGIVQHDDFIPVPAAGTPPTFTLPNSVIEPNRNQSLTATYSVARVGGSSQNSQPLPFRIGTAAVGLLAPTADEAPDGATLDPMAAVGGVTVRIPANASITSNDAVTVTLTGTPAGTETTPPTDGNPAGMSFTLRAALVALNLGQPIVIHYTVTPKAGGAPRMSAALRLNVLDFQPNDPRVPKPLVVEANGGFVLDLNTFAGDANVSVLVWPLMASGQRFWLRAIVGAASQILASNETVNVVGPISRSLPRNWLMVFPDQASLMLELKIAYDGNGEATARTFTSNSYTLRAELAMPTFPAPAVPEAVGGLLPGNSPVARLRVPAHAGLLAGDVATGFFGGSPLGSKPATPGAAMDFAIGGAMIAANIGRNVPCHYAVLRQGATWNSTNLMVAVTDPASGWDAEYNFDQDRIRDIGRWGTIYFPEGPGDVMDMQFDPDTHIDPAEKMGVEDYPYPDSPEFAGNCLYIGFRVGETNDNIVFINFHQNWDVARFAMTSVNRAVTVSFKDSRMNVISGIITVPGGNVEAQHEVKYDDQGRGRIRHVEIRSKDVIRLDSFKFRR